MKKLSLVIITLFIGCGIEPQVDVQPNIYVLPPGILTIEEAGCTCPYISSDDFILVPRGAL